jgi:hypothetical protein
MKIRRADSLVGLFTKPPEIMADMLSSRELFLGGPVGGLRVLTVYIAYAGKRLSLPQRQSLERVKEVLLDRTRAISAGECSRA